MNIVVLVSGRGTDLQSIIDATQEGWLKVNIQAVISDKEDAYALERAKQHGIPTYVLSKKVLKSEFQEALLNLLTMLSPDLVVLAGFLTILGPQVVERFPQKIINIHPALLPSFCGKGFYGMKVHEAVYESGVKYTGCTVHFVDAGVDAGPIILQEVVKVDDDDTPETIAEKVLEVEHRLLPTAIKLISEGRVVLEGRRVRILPASSEGSEGRNEV
ncbi:MAG TPA: phosphoribosylglycinamide formyltransferase [Coprothermobacter proteolyticus]|uniref:Phosphoribosylglycinamide formyltransferase n=1 Tax=Coprothermobacter proteolyticus (strain ATCC 35245 / DSM 5265 / OCM 4 / BT) TaxID=309798 RepID=B5Y720_COPPD|nr:phosphoribosylglycinamide formyltransferase [Coprothermobacter proteolyticus]ACI18251.1 phosphoribosylglycinamide formyltransferase [Coprothermobacter proteolyticus DSM 5265]HOA65090.1 phosphoribosylglycinamide formyltransferase [Coprothermobacter proteolyticus]HPU70275.1 phosphoribosylglycinamide formyltransferase [Coprothermobacter proteolyticus]HRC96314.1 phosphoribosylglycinamide formyltransferase [Coprothermobacter proteolyticus]